MHSPAPRDTGSGKHHARWVVFHVSRETTYFSETKLPLPGALKMRWKMSWSVVGSALARTGTHKQSRPSQPLVNVTPPGQTSNPGRSW
ncbi:hypothetical protein BD410DRAFT_787569 [Rickenella mellea]|uniref:Uncharacterized protein n=1 Tax=Rickenella mellea TaxID=50990 RepID=A0A4Y7Q7F8_9AGAM|nr:hypothetical protein BD410DRAFT_787569 [Rickenella mellea]